MMKPQDNTSRFDGLADIYAAYRPTYPADTIAALAERADTASVPRRAIDIGCGTGISTLALSQAMPDWQVIAAEPNAGMLAKARVTCESRPNIEFSAAGAESLPSEVGATGLVLAAQALHWFDHDRFFTEAARVLPPGGTLAILYNNRQNAVSVVLSEIEDYLESIDHGYSRDYRARDIPALLGTLEAFDNVYRHRKVWLKPTSCDDLVDYFMSRSMLKPLAAKVGISKIRHAIGDIASEHARQGMIDIPFAAELDMATRK